MVFEISGSKTRLCCQEVTIRKRKWQPEMQNTAEAGCFNRIV
jgi:hypothetical protein